MKKKHILYILISFIVITGLAVAIPKLLHTTLNNQVDLSNVKAVAYYGPSALAESSNGEAIFINRDGSIQKYESPNVEWGSIIHTEDEIIFNGREDIVQFNKDDSSIHKTESNCHIYAGYPASSGHLQDKNIYYELFNQGFTNPEDNLDDYRSTIRWSDGTENYCSDIPVYVVADGHDDKHLYVLTSSINEMGESVDLELIKYTINGKNLTEEKAYLREKGIDISHSRIVHYNDRLYVLYLEYEDQSNIEGNQLFKMLELDRNELKITNDYVLDTYTYKDDPIYFPFNRDGVMVKDNQLYFVNGFGEVNVVNLADGNSKKLFTFPDYEATAENQDENVQFSGEHIYFFHFDKEQDSHVIEVFTLNGEKLETIEVPELKDAVKNSNPIKFLFDFKVVE